MELVNELYASENEICGEVMREAMENVALLLAPFAPYLAQELWAELGNGDQPIFRQPWPAFDPELAREEQAEVVLQVNGKVRSRLSTDFGTDRQQLESMALADEKVRAFTSGKQIVKVIVVPDKLVNVVVK
jgi:leucyl-tRNA synthetase